MQPGSDPAIALLKYIYPQDDGRPSRQTAPNSELKSEYHDECERLGIPQSDRVKKELTAALRWP